MQCYIYALVDPRKPEDYRYIGKTTHSLKQRLRSHLSRQSLSWANYRVNWIKSLLAEGVKPEIKELECMDGDVALHSEREKHWVKLAKEQGHRLTNATDGGEFSFVFNEETKKLISERTKLAMQDPAIREKCRKGSLGKKQSPEIIEKRVSKYRGKPLSEEHRSKIGAANSVSQKGKTLPEAQRLELCEITRKRMQDPAARANISKKLKGITRSEETRAKMRAAWYARHPS